jgi:DNA-binding transcriptional LysR family regulator
MDLTQIRYFLALAETLNFTRAADRCNVTQPALTRAVQRLEEELGGALILRERALTQLTEFGRTMLPLLRQTAEAAEAVRSGATGFARRDGPVPLRIGLERCLPVRTLLPLLREVAAHIHQLELILAEDTPDALAEALLAGALDVALLPGMAPLPDRLSRWPLWTQGLAVLLPEGHPLAERAEVPAEALRGEALLPSVSAAAAAACARIGEAVPLRRAAHAAGSSMGALDALVALGLGIALVPAGAPHGPGCVERPLAGEGMALPVLLAVPAGRPMNPAVAAFVKLARARRWDAPSEAS